MVGMGTEEGRVTGCLALPPPSEYWRGQRKVLRQVLSGVSSEGSVGMALLQALRQPLAHHVQQYVLLLLSLGDTIGEVGSRVAGGRRPGRSQYLPELPLQGS